MKRRLLLLALFAQTSCLLAQVSGVASPALDSLLVNSPFGQRVAETGGSATSVIPLELRGVIVDNGEVLFSVFDFPSRSSRWVGLNEPGLPFTVRSYDRTKNEVKVDYQGRELTLGLKQATVIALAAAPAPVPPAGAAQPAATPAPPNNEAVRLAQIAEEIARRRALRQQAKQLSNPGQLPPPLPK